MQFEQLGLDSRLITALTHRDLTQATEIQQQAIPLALLGQDILASSKTGSGKTLAFLLPAVQRVLKKKALSARDARVVVLAPTRELAKQVFGELKLLVPRKPGSVALIVGGENFNDQAKLLRKDPEFIVATPGRLADHLEKRHLYLNGLEMLILDEADRMLDLGFGQALAAIDKAADHRQRQTLMFSATLDEPQVLTMAHEMLKQPKRIAVGAAHEKHEDILQQFHLANDLAQKENMLLSLLKLHGDKQIIVFTATRSDTERLSSLLEAQALNAIALSGELSQAKRTQIIEAFSQQKADILVTTDIASRGLDILSVGLVINFDVPKHAEEYVHRIGRTGRAGAKGLAISLIGPKDWYNFKAVERFLQRSVEFTALEGFSVAFKGLKPKRQAVKTHKPKPKASPYSEKSARPEKRFRKAGFVAGQQVGDVPMRRKKPTAEADTE